MCVCRVFALSQYLCTASGQRTRHLVTFPEVSLLAEKYFFDKQKKDVPKYIFLSPSYTGAPVESDDSAVHVSFLSSVFAVSLIMSATCFAQTSIPSFDR